MNEVWFIRHGESMANAGEIAIDRGSTVLTPKGHEQAKAASLRVTKRPDLIVVTPYIRTQLTAQPLRVRYPDVPCETFDLYEYSALSEKNYVGRTSLQRTPQMKAIWERNDPYYNDGPGAESFSDMVGRIMAAVERLRTYKNKFIVVYAHGYIVQATRLLLGKPGLSAKEIMRLLPYYMEHSPIENCAILRVEMDHKATRIHEEDFEKLIVPQIFKGD
jgi:probable phosphoglycerate mutase